MSIAGLNSLGTLLTGIRLPSPAAPAAPIHGGPRTEPNALVGRLLERAIGAPNDPNATGVGRWLDVRAKQVSVSEDTSLTIRTAEGDTVTLTSHTEMESLKARLTYGPGDAPDADEHGDDDGVEGATSVRLRELRLDRSVTLSVQGDLSDEELADIRELVERLGDTLHDAGHDDDHAGTRSLVRLSTEGFDSLAGFELHAERTVEVTRVHGSHRRRPRARTRPHRHSLRLDRRGRRVRSWDRRTRTRRTRSRRAPRRARPGVWHSCAWTRARRWTCGSRVP
ncbi:MAG: hypothetical protein RL721_209, partial [Candidatus Eisenbacteria bacterium]